LSDVDGENNNDEKKDRRDKVKSKEV